MTDAEQAAACLIAAHEYAERGWRVIPIKPGGKYPAGFGEWQLKATTDPAIIEGWWNGTHKGYGVGIATGPESGVWVLDIDVADGKAGDDTLAELERINGALPETCTAITGSGGGHMFFTYPTEGDPVRNDAARRLGHGLDVRGDGGFVVAAPSIHPVTGRAYEWDVGLPDDVADAPAWLLKLVTEIPDQNEAPMRPRELGPDASPGDRFAMLHTWSEVLTPEGWTLGHIDRYGEHHWVRPGKDKRQGTSATTGYTEADNLCVFTSSVPNLPPAQYTKLGYVAAVRFGGDMRAAALDMVRSGSTEMPFEEMFAANVRSALDAGTPPRLTDAERAPAAEVLAIDSGPDTAPEPVPLRSIHIERDLPAWPVDMLPRWMAEHCIATADRLQSPLDLSCQLALGALAAAAMGHATVRRGSWVEPLNLYTWCAVHSGAGKSPTEAAIVGPLRRWAKAKQDSEAEDHRLQLAQWRAAKKQAKDAEESYANTNGSAVTDEELVSALNAAAKPAPQAFRLTIDDVTPQRLVQLLGDHRYLAMISAEGGLFDTVVAQFGRGTATPAVDVYLKAWSGDTIERDRVGPDGVSESVSISGALLTTVLAVQPSVIQRYQQTAPELRSRGFFARFMPSIPALSPGTRLLDAVALEPGAEADRYGDEVYAFADRLSHLTRTVELHLDAAADERFVAWYNAVEVECQPDERLWSLGEMVAKIRSSVLRTAGLLALSEHADGVTDAHMVRAITIGEYWIAHALEMERTSDITEAADDSMSELAQRMVRHLRRRDGVSRPRDMLNAFRRPFNLRTVDDLIPTLVYLQDAGWIVFTEGTADGVGTRGVSVVVQLTDAGMTGDIVPKRAAVARERVQTAENVCTSENERTRSAHVLSEEEAQGIRGSGENVCKIADSPLPDGTGASADVVKAVSQTYIHTCNFPDTCSPERGTCNLAHVLGETPKDTGDAPITNVCTTCADVCICGENVCTPDDDEDWL